MLLGLMARSNPRRKAAAGRGSRSGGLRRSDDGWPSVLVPDLPVVMVPVAELVPYAGNARLHSAAQVRLIARSIEAFGWTSPVLLGEGSAILAGHGRVLAARRLGLRVVPCLRLEHLSAAQRRAYIVADNRLAELASWDDALRDAELADLALLEGELGFSLEEVGLGAGADASLGSGRGGAASGSGPSLEERFLVPPFTVLDAGGAAWVARRSAWASWWGGGA